MKTGMCLPAARATSAPRTGAHAANTRSGSVERVAPTSYPAGGRCHSSTSLPSRPAQRYRSRSCPTSPPRPRHTTPKRMPNSRASVGHPAGWPTLAREFGIRFGVVWRGLGGEVGQERDLYRWAGLDGKEVLLWHLPPAGYEVGATLSTDPERVFAAWAPVRGALVARAAGKHIPVFIGADHHAAHPEVSRLRDVLAELDPQSAYRVSRLDEFFQVAAEGAKPAPLAGELRWSYRYAWTLQGGHATRAPLKRRYGEAELALTRLGAPLAALARRAGGRDRRPLLERAWRGLVRCPFPDSIAGWPADAVARAAETGLGALEALPPELVRGSVHDL